MRRNLPRRHIIATAVGTAASGLFAGPAGAIIFHSTGDPTYNTTAPGGSLLNSGWQYEGSMGSFLLGTPVGPHHFLTAAHLNPQVGTTLDYNGVTYTVTGFQDFDDLRLLQVADTFHSYAPLWDSAALADTPENGGLVGPAVVIGRGRTRGSTVTVDSVLKGWNWGDNDHAQRWGQNAVSDFASYAVIGDLRLLKFSFDAGGGANEAHLAENDSGGAVFLKSPTTGEWKLAGISYAVSGPYRMTETGDTFLAALFDTRGLHDDDGELIEDEGSAKPSFWYATRISSHLASITAQLGLAPTWKVNDAGNWNSSINWTDLTVPNAVGAVADFRSVINADRTVTLNSTITVGTINFDNPTARYTIAGANTLTLNVASGSAVINVASGAHTISAPVSLSDATTFNVIAPSATLTISNTLSATGRNLTKQGAGALEVKNLRAASLAVNGGTVKVIADGSSAGTSKLATLTTSGGGKLDVTNNELVVTSTAIGSWNGSTYTGVSGMVRSGRNGGAWNGSGIVSSSAAANPALYTVGVATAAQAVGATATAVWSGQTVSPGDVLVKYTYAGDANLDGKINIDDYGQIDFNVVNGGLGYFNGDFNYDGKINIDDYGIIDFNLAAQLGQITSASSDPALEGIAAVPEPSTLAIVAAAGAGLLGGRRRSSGRRAWLPAARFRRDR